MSDRQNRVSASQFQSAPVDTCRLQKAETDLEADPGAYCVGYRSRSHQPNDEGGQSCQTDAELKTANTR